MGLGPGTTLVRLWSSRCSWVPGTISWIWVLCPCTSDCSEWSCSQLSWTHPVLPIKGPPELNNRRRCGKVSLREKWRSRPLLEGSFKLLGRLSIPVPKHPRSESNRRGQPRRQPKQRFPAFQSGQYWVLIFVVLISEVSTCPHSQ